MRRALAATLALLLLAMVLAPGAHAALNKPQPFQESFPYMAGVGESGTMTVVSGKVSAELGQAGGSYGFFGTRGATITGLEQVCWQGNGCSSSSARAMSIRIEAGGAFSVCFPAPAGGTLEAGHALALFVDLAQDDDLNTFPVDKSLVAPLVDGEFAFGPIAAIPAVGLTPAALAAPCTSAGGAAALDDGTRMVIRDGGGVVATLTGKAARAAFAGQPAIAPQQADFVVLPFGDPSRATFTKASAGDASSGLDLARVQDLLDKLDAAHAGSTVQRGEAETGGNNTQEVLAGLLNGALVRLPDAPADTNSLDLDGSHFIRFRRLAVEGQGAGLSWSGTAYLEVQDGKVAGARSIVGFWLFQLPWWSYVLWAIALTLAIVRLMLKPDKNHPRWDALRWVGWVFTPVAWILVILLWDLEMHAAFGASLMRGTSGQFKLIVGLLQFALLGLVAFAAAAPLRVIFRNTSLLAHQGTFMGLAGGTSAILGYLIGAPYLRAYLGLILSKVLERLG